MLRKVTPEAISKLQSYLESIDYSNPDDQYVVNNSIFCFLEIVLEILKEEVEQ